MKVKRLLLEYFLESEFSGVEWTEINTTEKFIKLLKEVYKWSYFYQMTRQFKEKFMVASKPLIDLLINLFEYWLDLHCLIENKEKWIEKEINNLKNLAGGEGYNNIFRYIFNLNFKKGNIILNGVEISVEKFIKEVLDTNYIIANYGGNIVNIFGRDFLILQKGLSEEEVDTIENEDTIRDYIDNNDLYDEFKQWISNESYRLFNRLFELFDFNDLVDYYYLFDENKLVNVYKKYIIPKYLKKHPTLPKIYRKNKEILELLNKEKESIDERIVTINLAIHSIHTNGSILEYLEYLFINKLNDTSADFDVEKIISEMNNLSNGKYDNEFNRELEKAKEFLYNN